MKTRAEIYGNEAAALLRIVTMYPGLNMQQLLCFHPDKEEIIKTLLSHLQKQGRIFQTDTGGYFPSGWAAKSDNSLIRAAWVLLDFIGQVEYHAPGDFSFQSSSACFLKVMHLARCIHGAETGNARAVNAANVFRIIDQNDAASTAAVIPKRMVDQGLLAGS